MKVDPFNTARQRQVTRLAWLVLAYNIPVILWGAYVRVSFSGDGCGANWPFCNGQLLPSHMQTPTIVEFTHRLMTSLDSLLMIALVAGAFGAFPKAHAVRRFAVWSIGFLFVEALLGAGLVLLRKVAHDQSSGRAVYLAAHLVNTLLLLGAITATAWSAQKGRDGVRLTRINGRILAALGLIGVVSITGVIAALGDMLFPAASLAAGLAQDASTASAALLRLRFLHPLLAIGSAVYVLVIAIQTLRRVHNTNVRESAGRVLMLVLAQVAAGFLNLGLLAPIWMQLIHLLLADVLWIATLVWAFEEQLNVGAQPARKRSFETVAAHS